MSLTSNIKDPKSPEFGMKRFTFEVIYIGSCCGSIITILMPDFITDKQALQWMQANNDDYIVALF